MVEQGVNIIDFDAYRGQISHLVTKHSKSDVIAPVFLEKLGVFVETLEADTDELGTFSGEIERTKPQLQTAIDKALLANRTLDSKLCLASEGTIGMNPAFPVLISDTETIVFVDCAKDLVIHHTIVSHEIYSFRTQLQSVKEIDSIIGKLNLRDQAMIVKSSDSAPEFVRKGLLSLNSIRESVAASIEVTGVAILEPDFRAMHSASRRKNIEKCAIELAGKIASRCPICSRPGWSPSPSEEKKSCMACGGDNTTVALGRVFRCDGCGHLDLRPEIEVNCKAQHCLDCNP